MFALYLIIACAACVTAGFFVEYNKRVGVKVERALQGRADVGLKIFCSGSAFQSEFPILRFKFRNSQQMLCVAYFQWTKQDPIIFEYKSGCLLW